MKFQGGVPAVHLAVQRFRSYRSGWDLALRMKQGHAKQTAWGGRKRAGRCQQPRVVSSITKDRTSLSHIQKGPLDLALRSVVAFACWHGFCGDKGRMRSLASVGQGEIAKQGNEKHIYASCWTSGNRSETHPSDRGKGTWLAPKRPGVGQITSPYLSMWRNWPGKFEWFAAQHSE